MKETLLQPDLEIPEAEPCSKTRTYHEPAAKRRYLRRSREETSQAEINRANDPYQLLASEVIIRAVKDYRNALRRLKRRPDNVTAKITKDDCEAFFTSEQFMMMTRLNGEKLMEILKKEIGYDG